MRGWMIPIGILLLASVAFGQITVAVAANVQFAMEQMREDFKKRTGTDVKAVYGSSGKFTMQIRSGAPMDVFVSADMDFPDSLFRWKYASAAPKVYAYGKLILWTTRHLDLSRGMAVLEDSAVGKIALADPKKAPYGRETFKALRRTGQLDKVEGKFVFGENLSQVSQYILSGNVDIGFDAKSVVLSAEASGKGKWVEVDSTLYDRIAQGAVITKYGMDSNPALSKSFYDYLYSEPARAILLKYGYVLP